MKRVTHPQLEQSVIQWKDGSLYLKQWLYFRPILHVDVEIEKHLLWKKAAEAVRLDAKFQAKKNVNNQSNF